MGDQLMGGEPPALLRHATGHQVGVAILFRHVVRDVPKRILQRGTLEKPDRPVTIKTLMNKFVAITKPFLSKQLRLPIIGIPAAMFDPPTQEIVLPRHEVRIRFRSTVEHLPNLFPQLWRHPLIAIQTENPLMSRECDCLIAQIPESFEVNLIDLIRKLTTDCSRLIVTVGIHDDQLIAPACHRLKAGPHIGLVVVRDDIDRQFRHEALSMEKALRLPGPRAAQLFPPSAGRDSPNRDRPRKYTFRTSAHQDAGPIPCRAAANESEDYCAEGRTD